MSKMPYMPLYTRDYLADPCLGQCSAATRGIWADMLCLMHENGRTGKLVGNIESLAQVCRCSPVEMRAAVDQLNLTNTANVTERHGVVTLINRRMARDHHEREMALKRQKRKRTKQTSDLCHAPVTALSQRIAVADAFAIAKEEDVPATGTGLDSKTPDADVLACLDHLGIGEPERTRLAGMDGITTQRIEKALTIGKASRDGCPPGVRVKAIRENLPKAIEAERVAAERRRERDQAERDAAERQKAEEAKVEAERLELRQFIDAMPDDELQRCFAQVLADAMPNQRKSWSNEDPRTTTRPGLLVNIRAVAKQQRAARRDPVEATTP